jgi:hypothetical protein
MKPQLLAALLALSVGACEKTDDIARHQAEATVLAKYYAPLVQTATKRALADKALVDDVKEEHREATQRIDRAITILSHLGGLVSATERSPVENEAAKHAKAGAGDEVVATVDRAREQLDQSLTAVAADLDAVEGFVAQVGVKQMQLGRFTPAPPAPPTPPPTPTHVTDTTEPAPTPTPTPTPTPEPSQP